MNPSATMLAGDSGARFWPKRRTNSAKPCLTLQGRDLLWQNLTPRIAPLSRLQPTPFSTAAHQDTQTLERLPSVPESHGLAAPACTVLQKHEQTGYLCMV